MPLPPHARPAVLFLLGHLAIGAVGALLVGGLVLWLDLAGLGTLVARSEHRWLITALLLFGLVVTFGGCAMGAGIMGMKRDRSES